MNKIAPGALTARRQFDGAVNSSDAWQSVAEDLLAAVTLLTDPSVGANASLSGAHLTAADPHRYRVQPVALMLRGMAAECLLKARWLRGGQVLAENGHFRPVPGARMHDLSKLALVCGFEVTPAEAYLLQRLSHFIEYGGRYPTPKDAHKLDLLPTPDGGYSAATTWSTPSDDEAFNALVHRLMPPAA